MATLKLELTLADTQFGCTIATKERELDAAVDFMSWEERERMMSLLQEKNVEEALVLIQTTGDFYPSVSGEWTCLNEVNIFPLHSD